MKHGKTIRRKLQEAQIRGQVLALTKREDLHLLQPDRLHGIFMVVIVMAIIYLLIVYWRLMRQVAEEKC